MKGTSLNDLIFLRFRSSRYCTLIYKKKVQLFQLHSNIRSISTPKVTADTFSTADEIWIAEECTRYYISVSMKREIIIIIIIIVSLRIK